MPFGQSGTRTCATEIELHEFLTGIGTCGRRKD